MLAQATDLQTAMAAASCRVSGLTGPVADLFLTIQEAAPILGKGQ